MKKNAHIYSFTSINYGNKIQCYTNLIYNGHINGADVRGGKWDTFPRSHSYGPLDQKLEKR